MRIRQFRTVVVLLSLSIMLALPLLQAKAGRSEFGVGVPVSTSFSLSSFSYGLEAYYRLAGAILAWETALRTGLSFSSLYIRNTVTTAGALFLSAGHVTNLLPYFGSTYFTTGLGFTLGQLLVIRTTLNLAISVGGGSVFFFPELRFQFGIDP